MPLTLHTIQPAKNSKKPRKKIGRGGKRGTYSGKGQKGQKSRSGVSGLKRLGMRQMIEQTHKLRGFKSLNPKPETVNIKDLVKKFKDGDTISPETLKKAGLTDKIEKGVKILSIGDISIKLNVELCEISATAKAKIEKAGGSVKQ